MVMHDAALLDVGRAPRRRRLKSSLDMLAIWISTPTRPHITDYTDIHPRRRSGARLHQLRPASMPTALAHRHHLHQHRF
jgi:hypothetical protein